MSLPKRVEMLSTGDELLDGRVSDMNCTYLARGLQRAGARLAQCTSVPDDEDAIVREARAVMGRGTELCVVSGGLGPTTDDLTREAFATLAGVELWRDPEAERTLEELFKRRRRPMTENQRRQAERPQGALRIDNPVGTAPGFEIVVGSCRFVSLPGVPSEFQVLLERTVIEPLCQESGGRDSLVLRSFGLWEAEVDALLTDLSRRTPEVRLGYRAAFPEIHVSLSVATVDHAALQEATAFVREKLGAHLFGQGEQTLAGALLDALRQRGATLALAESCTGGLMGDLITDVPGSSDVLLLSVVAYANQAKIDLLGVEPATLAAHGAVSAEVALEMAAGARAKSGASYALAATGIAGPGGATPDKPVGTVFIAAVGPDLQEWRKLSLPFDRRRNKVASAASAFDLLRRKLVG